MKTLLRSLATVALLLAIGCGLAIGLSSCSYVAGVGHALTGQNATLTVEIVGTSVDAVMKAAAKAYHAGDITKAQWDAIAALDARYLPVYEAEKNAIEKANAPGVPSASLTGYLAQFYSLAESFKKPASPTPAK